MQKPDENGFITVNWPSKNVPYGGVFHNQIANPTEDQRELLKVLLEESKLTLSLNQKKALALRQRADKKTVQKPQAERQTSRPRTSRRRSLSEIRESGVFNQDDYRPLKRGEDRELMKEKLANTMTYGDDQEPPALKALPPSIPKTERKLPTNKEKWNDLVSQIRERTEWLAEMEYLGQADPHRNIISNQIAERMRALDELGIDSECSTSRSTASGFSTLRSEQPEFSKKPVSATQSEHSNHSVKAAKNLSVRSSARRRTKEENVESYAQFTPLQRSPRRRQ